LRVLRPLARLVAPILLALHRTRVARDEAGLLERGAVFRVDLEERARDAVADGNGLGAHTTPADVHVGRVLSRRRGDLEGLADDQARRLATEVLVRRTGVDRDLTAAGAEPHARHRGLALTGSGEDVALCAHCCRRS